VLRARGKALEAAHDDWSLDALGLLNHQQVVISRTLGKGSSDVDGSDGSSGSTSANEAARKGSEEKNKQFVGDLLFGHTSPGFGFLSGGNSSDSTGLGNNGSIGGGCLGGALNSHGGSSNGGGSGGGGVSVRDLYRVKHGLQLLSNGLRLEVCPKKKKHVPGEPLLVLFQMYVGAFRVSSNVLLRILFCTTSCDSHALILAYFTGASASVQCVARRRNGEAARKRPPSTLARR